VLLTRMTGHADGLFTIQNISFYQDAGLALGQSGEDDWKRQGLYMGPAVRPFFSSSPPPSLL
jgi:hypothetical protein